MFIKKRAVKSTDKPSGSNSYPAMVPSSQNPHITYRQLGESIVYILLPYISDLCKGNMPLCNATDVERGENKSATQEYSENIGHLHIFIC